MLGLKQITAAGILLIGLSTNLFAEEINMPANENQSSEFSIQLPGRGMSMEMVQKRFGEASETFSSVGEPPITKWSYKTFTVYFESQFVIHAVVNN